MVVSRKEKSLEKKSRDCVEEKLGLFGTGDGNRTHVSGLGSSRPTIERRPHTRMRSNSTERMKGSQEEK